MKNTILTLLMIFSFFSFVNSAEFSMPTYETPLLEVKEGYGKIIDSPDIIIGSSGVVMHTFSNGESSIIARAVVTEKTGTLAKIRFEVFGMLEQVAFPLPGILPQSGDKIILNFLYSRSLIIAPNKEVHDEIIKHFSNITFINPDILGAHLVYKYKPNPSRDDFRKMCANNSAGIIFIALNGESVIADCGSFEILKKFKTGGVSNYQLPFYTRVKNITTAFWDFKNGQINNYEKHYRYLLGEDVYAR